MKVVKFDNRYCAFEREYLLVDYDRQIFSVNYYTNDGIRIYFANDGFKMFDKNKNRIFGHFIEAESVGIYCPDMERYNIGKLFTSTHIIKKIEDVELVEWN